MFLQKRTDPPIPLPPRPYVIRPSGSFDGNDGKWSTFFFNIGDSDGTGHGQTFKFLMSTSSPLTLAPQQTEWCDEDCAVKRGISIFNGEQPLGLVQSQSWITAGTYDIPLPYWWSNDLSLESESLGGVWGSENVGIGESSPQSDILAQQYVVKYTFRDFYLGSFGLAAGEVGPPGGTKPNFLNNFCKSANMIASVSYGYTAGAFYRNDGKGVLGSLVLGGYDKSRLRSQGTSIQMPSDRNNSLVVGVMSILYAPDQDVEANTFSFTKGGFSATIDSTLPYLILPDDILAKFQERFRLTYNEDTRFYTVNSSSHEWNLQQNATVSFKIGAGPRDSDIFTSIELPYAAFDLQLSSPITANTTQYFPIRRSDNGIYVLGRTFLQEAYIIVDYERANFTVAPAYYSMPLPEESLVTIFNKTYMGIPRQESSDSGLSGGAIAGIVVGIIVAFLIAGMAAFLWWRRRRHAKKNDMAQYEKPSEIDTVAAGNEVKYRRVSELTGSEGPQSPKTAPGPYQNEHKTIPPISEMSPESPPVELYSPPPETASDRDSQDYFAAGKVRRRGATRDSTGQNTPRTPIAELPGDEGSYPVQSTNALNAQQSTVHARGISDTSLSTNIDEVLAGKQEQEPKPSETAASTQPVSQEHPDKSVDAEGEQHDASERRPSHARGLSDTTIQSDSTAVSQPTPEELERWARSGDDEPRRPLSQ